jgi:hypothetical protein
METVDLIKIGLTNFASLLIIFWLGRLADSNRKRKLAKLVLEEMGERVEMEQNFKKIIDSNFRHMTDGQEDRNE